MPSVRRSLFGEKDKDKDKDKDERIKIRGLPPSPVVPPPIMSAKKVPVSAYVETHGMRFFARSLSKIRYFAAGELREDFHANLGKAMDAFLCDYLRVSYEDLRERTLQGGTDEEILAWAQEKGRDLSAIDIRIWNHFITKLGWKDDMTHRFLFRKEEAGLMDRDDIETIVDVLEADEGRSASAPKAGG